MINAPQESLIIKMIILIKSYIIAFIRRHRFSILMKFMLIKGDKDILFKGKHSNSQSKLYCQIFLLR